MTLTDEDAEHIEMHRAFFRFGVEMARRQEEAAMQRLVRFCSAPASYFHTHHIRTSPTLIAIVADKRPAEPGPYRLRNPTINGTTVGKTWAPRITL